MVFCGIDTSAYTTSLALVDAEEKLIWENRRGLPVAIGERGMRQSEAVFCHLKAIPLLWEEACAVMIGPAGIRGVAVSVKPRPLPSSYMPVFTVGESFGKFLALTLGVPLMSSTHQEGHFFSGLWSRNLPPGDYLVLHLSGGTTELLAVAMKERGAVDLEIVGGTRDISAGQFIDRVGVSLGMSFPAGASLEKLSLSSNGEASLELPVSVKGPWLSFSGPESQAQRCREKGCAPGALARAVENCIARSLLSITGCAVNRGPYLAVMIVGGVAANKYIVDFLRNGLTGMAVHPADPRFATDNAVGLAVQARRIICGS